MKSPFVCTALALVLALALHAGHPAHGADYGPELACIRTIDKPGIMDAVVSGNHLYFVGNGHLYVADITDASAPRLIGDCPFQGEGRQLAVANGIAYITARANGVFIVDVRDPQRPQLLCHYDCIELATGVEVQGDLLFIAQRQFGVEIVNISDPRRPAYVSKIKTDEAQSVDVRGNYIYVGDWGTCKLTTIDIRDPYRPTIVASHGLQGFGDGVCVAGDYLYASTGHHSKPMPSTAKDEPGFGEGHGVEVYSLKVPGKPEFLGRTKFPRLYHREKYDMWTPVAAGDVVCCADTFNGVFVVNVADPRNPRTVAHYPHFAAGLAVVDHFIYVACGPDGLKVLAAPGLVRRTTCDRGPAITVPPAPRHDGEKHRVYRPGGQVWAVDFCGDYALVAAGMKGLRVVELWPEIREVSQIDTQGFAVHACVFGERAYVSENTGGFSIWKHTGKGKLSLLCRHQPPGGQAVRQAMVYAGGTRAVLQCGSQFLVLDVSDPARPRQIARHKAAIIYGDQMSHGDLGGRYACVWDHISGVRWLDLAASGEKIDTGVNLNDKYSFFAGITSLGDQFLCTYSGAYRLAKPLDTDLEAKPAYRFAKSLLGKPSVFGRGLFLASRVQSAIAIVDITDVQRPRLLGQFPTAGNPGTVVVRNEALIVPDGHNGLLVYDDFVKSLDLKVDRQSFLKP